MKLKYRIKKYKFLNAKTCFIAQYKILGIWMNINVNLTGQFMISGTVNCENSEEAFERIEKHKQNMKRAEEIFTRYSTIIWKD